MRVVRLYTHQSLAPGSTLELEDTIRHYALNVLRLNKRSSLILFNGDGNDYPCEILDYSKTNLRVIITEKISLDSESSLETHLYISVSKSSHMDYAIQKSVEAGVSIIHPILTERSVNKSSNKSAENKRQHWQRIIQSACEQCGRAVIPTLSPICKINEIDELDTSDCSLMLDANSNQTMNNLNIVNPTSIKLLIGPEGGLTESEINAALHKGFKAVRCGPRVLRTETAAVTAIILAQQLWGDLAG
ncbi:MAG: 16S rRNA (uracil(1498)-N(3))-methyltransferase [Gammaproteobacteria bacterium]